MTTTEKLWISEVAMMYPKQWIVMVDLEDEKGTNKTFGVVHHVTSNKDEAHTITRAIIAREGRRKAMTLEGWDDTPQIGGLWSCRQ